MKTLTKTQLSLSKILTGLAFTLGALSTNIYAGEQAMQATDEPTLQRELPSSFYTFQPSSDDALKSALIEQFKQEGGIDLSKLDVEAQDGVIKLSGTALNEVQVKRIIQIARSPVAVKWVESTVKPEDSTMTSDSSQS